MPRNLQLIQPRPTKDSEQWSGCRLRDVWYFGRCPTARFAMLTLQVARREAAHPTSDELAHRDEQGLYSASEPFWARVKSAALLTAPNSDRRVRGVQRCVC